MIKLIVLIDHLWKKKIKEKEERKVKVIITYDKNHVTQHYVRIGT